MIFVHGSLGDYRSWRNQVEPFSRRYRTLILSLRHCYPEIWDGEGGNLSLHQHVLDLAAFIKTLNLQPAHLVGHSRGGAVVLKLACLYPDLIRSMVLVDPAPFIHLFNDHSQISPELEKRNAVITASLDLLENGELDQGLEVFTDAVSRPGAWKSLPESAKQIRRDNAWSLKSLITDSQEPIDCADLKGIQRPCLLMNGEFSPRVYSIMHRRIEQCLEAYDKGVVMDASHGMHVDNPESFNAILEDFLMQILPD